MNEPLLRADRPVTLIGGGAVAPEDLLEAMALAPQLVAADGGADRALAMGAMPDLVIGDLDSISEGARAQIPADRLHQIAEQDSTDFEKCLTRIAAPLVIAVGFGGGRLDHQLAVLHAMSRTTQPPVLLLGGEDICFLAPPRLALDLAAGTRVSLFPMGAARGRSRGLKWPINGIEFAPDQRVGTSNITTGPVDLEIAGPMLVILPRTLLAPLAAVLR